WAFSRLAAPLLTLWILVSSIARTSSSSLPARSQSSLVSSHFFRTAASLNKFSKYLQQSFRNSKFVWSDLASVRAGSSAAVLWSSSPCRRSTSLRRRRTSFWSSIDIVRLDLGAFYQKAAPLSCGDSAIKPPVAAAQQAVALAV